MVQAALRDNKISMGHARAIINIDDPNVQLSIFQKIIAEDWSVRKVEDAVRGLTVATMIDQSKTRKPNIIKQEIRSLQYKLSSLFGTKVSIKSDDQSKGEIKIPFASQEELDKILGSLKV